MGCNSSKIKNTDEYSQHGKIMTGTITAIGHKAVTIRDTRNREWYSPLNKLSPELKRCGYYDLLYKKINFRANTHNHSGYQASGPRYYATEITNFIIIL
jgi:hypothetical protein